MNKLTPPAIGGVFFYIFIISGAFRGRLVQNTTFNQS